MRCIHAILAVVLAASSLFAGALPEGDEAKYRADLTEGITLLRSGSHDEISRAIAKFKAALKVRPESAEAYYWLALAYSDQHNYPRAADNAREATTYDDRLAEAWLLWGQVLMYQREWVDARIKLETADRLAPENPAVLFNLGRVQYHGFSDPDAALAKFRHAWQLGQGLRRTNPEMIAMTVRARMYVGVCEYERGMRQGNMANINNAVNAFQDVIREQPNNYDVHFRLALALRRSDRTAECEAILRSLAGLIPETGAQADRNLLAEVNLQLADLSLNESNWIYGRAYLQDFVRLVGDSNHYALEAVKDYLAQLDSDGADS